MLTRGHKQLLVLGHRLSAHQRIGSSVIVGRRLNAREYVFRARILQDDRITGLVLNAFLPPVAFRKNDLATVQICSCLRVVGRAEWSGVPSGRYGEKARGLGALPCICT